MEVYPTTEQPSKQVQQPPQQQQQQTVVVVTQPHIAMSSVSQNARDWSTGLCGCFENVCSCFYAYFMFPCFMCNLSSRLGECSCGPFILGRPFEVALRTKLRTMHGIQGSVLNDCCLMTFCQFCAATQMDRELDNISRSRLV